MANTIRNLFDPQKDIYRNIEKVITYSASQEDRLRAEIAEYIVTEHIEEEFLKLLDKMQLAMESGGENEIGVWVSGFYGSGKSSFTKYLGLAFDNGTQIDGDPFIKRLQDRMNKPQTKALLDTVARRFPAEVVLLDLAGEMLAGATLAEVSSVLYFKVLQWAGYSRNLKVFALELRLKKDGRFDEFERKLEEKLPGLTWKELQNDPLVVDSLIPQIAHEMYPQLFLTPTAFNTSTEDFLKLENQRVEEMLSIIREKNGKQHVIFIVDELGQYIANSDEKILNTQGLAQNLKRLGGGKVWFIATAQQTLTQDDPRAALNSEKLYKLKDRFPIQIELESSDIKEICYRRLLGKSPEGQEELGKLFDAHGQALRFNVRLKEAKYYDSDFDRQNFINLYPFLPAHFDILLHLLGALAKSTGGIGLRSAIKVIQDILVESGGERTPAAGRPVGWLATTVTLYDSLEKEIQRNFSSIHQAVETCLRVYRNSLLHAEIAKSIAVLQILGNLPLNAENLAALTHPSVSHPSRLDDVRKVVEEMLNEPLVPLSDKEGSLYFLSEKLRDIEQERGLISLRDIEVQRIFNNALRASIDPLPRASLGGSFTVTAGLKVRSGNDRVSSLAGEQNHIQLVVNLTSGDYETSRNSLVDESRDRANQNVIFLIARENPDAIELAREIYRCEQIVEKHRGEPSQEVKDYCSNQTDRAGRLGAQLQHKLKQTLSQGSFVFHGQYTAITALDQDLLESARKMLGDVAKQVFDRYDEAPARVETSLAEKFLRVNNPAALTSALDPLGLVEIAAGKPNFKMDHKALVSISDYIERNGTVEGKRLSDHFSDPPFGWSPDTLRYILAAMLIAGEIKLKVSGLEVTTAGQKAIEALKTNNSFKSVGVALRDERPSIETLAHAAERLTDLIGEMILPLEPDIIKAATRHLPGFQHNYAPLAEKLSALQLAGVDRVRSLNQEIKDVLFTDASDAPQRFGSEVSALYDNLKWAGEARKALDNGLETTVRELQTHRREITALPSSGVPGDLQRELDEELSRLGQRLQQDDFYHHSADFNSLLTDLKSRVRDAVAKLREQQKQRLKEGAEDLQRLPEWEELTQEERGSLTGNLEGLLLDVSPDLNGLKQLLARDYDINTRLSQLKESIRRQGQERQLKRIEEERAKIVEKGPVKVRKSVAVPASLTTAAQLDDLIRQLQELKQQMTLGAEIELNFTIQD
jgi:hypothetical protein